MEGQGMGMQFGREEMQRGGRGGRELGGGVRGDRMERYGHREDKIII